jgi:hypothetical protein
MIKRTPEFHDSGVLCVVSSAGLLHPAEGLLKERTDWIAVVDAPDHFCGKRSAGNDMQPVELFFRRNPE